MKYKYCWQSYTGVKQIIKIDKRNDKIKKYIKNISLSLISFISLYLFTITLLSWD